MKEYKLENFSGFDLDELLYKASKYINTKSLEGWSILQITPAIQNPYTNIIVMLVCDAEPLFAGQGDDDA